MKANQKAVNVVEWLINLIMFYHTHIHNEFSIAQKFLGLKFKRVYAGTYYAYLVSDPDLKILFEVD